MKLATKTAAKKLFRSINPKKIGLVRATSPAQKPVVIITSGDSQVIRIYDGKFFIR